jgi:VanZ family protein
MSPFRPPATSSDNLVFRLVRATWFWRTALGVLTAVVLYLALMPAPPHTLDTGWDKLNHALAFASLAVCSCFSGSASPRRLLIAGALLVAFGGMIELLQSQIPGRDAEWGDLLADTIGMVVGMLSALSARRLATAASR